MPIMPLVTPLAKGLVKEAPAACMVVSTTSTPPAFTRPKMGAKIKIPKNMMANWATSVHTTAYMPPTEV